MVYRSYPEGINLQSFTTSGDSAAEVAGRARGLGRRGTGDPGERFPMHTCLAGGAGSPEKHVASEILIHSLSWFNRMVYNPMNYRYIRHKP